jgi:hypothetical protein
LNTVRLIELIYPHGQSASCPDAIGRHLAAELEPNYEVRLHDWDRFGALTPRSDAALVGHAHPLPGTLFRRSSRKKGWARVVLLQPFSHDFRQVGYLRNIVPRCDEFLAITGPYWTRNLSHTPFAPWAQGMVQVDLAVDTHEFPPVKSRTQPPGHRRFLYVGSDESPKNLSYLDAIARELNGFEFHWIGTGRRSWPHLRTRGYHDLASDAGRQLIDEFDLMITVGSADANPAAIVEGMAWGLVPICTRESGWDTPGRLFFLPRDDVGTAAKILRELQFVPSVALEAVRHHNWHALREHYNWRRFADQVRTALETDRTRQWERLPHTASTTMALGQASGWWSPLRPRVWLRALMANATSRAK